MKPSLLAPACFALLALSAGLAAPRAARAAWTPRSVDEVRAGLADAPALLEGKAEDGRDCTVRIEGANTPSQPLEIVFDTDPSDTLTMGRFAVFPAAWGMGAVGLDRKAGVWDAYASESTGDGCAMEREARIDLPARAAWVSARLRCAGDAKPRPPGRFTCRDVRPAR